MPFLAAILETGSPLSGAWKLFISWSGCKNDGRFVRAYHLSPKKRRSRRRLRPSKRLLFKCAGPRLLSSRSPSDAVAALFINSPSRLGNGRLVAVNFPTTDQNGLLLAKSWFVFQLAAISS